MVNEKEPIAEDVVAVIKRNGKKIRTIRKKKSPWRRLLEIIRHA